MNANVSDNEIIDPPVPKAYLRECADESSGVSDEKRGRENDTLGAAQQAGSVFVLPDRQAKTRCELPYFNVDEMIGGNQELFSDPWMRIGGCAAVTACDICIYMDKYKGTKGLYPYDVNSVSKADYERFAMLMKPYLRPRYSGINKLSTYIEGLSRYLSEHAFQCSCIPNNDGKLTENSNPGDKASVENKSLSGLYMPDSVHAPVAGGIQLYGFEGNHSYSEARRFIIEHIDAGFPIPYLNLYHRDPALSDFVWHWFILAGYAVYADTMMVKVISYGECYWFDLARLWNTGHRRKGGMIGIY